MKKTIAILIAAVLAVSALSACSININLNTSTEEPTIVEATTAATTAATDPTATEAETKAAAGKLEDYVKTAAENTVTSGDGKTNTLRYPEILLDSSDAKAANKELSDKFAEAIDGTRGAYAIDYEAYLNGNILSVVTMSKLDGGNTFGLCYNFDVTTGKKLSNQDICAAAGKTYDELKKELKEKITAHYDDKWSSVPGNEEYREKTLSDDNLNAAVFYLTDGGKVSALADTYAAVGGGHWVVQFDL